MKQFNWKQNILTALITIVVTVVGGMALYYFQFSEPKLVYSFDRILPFKGQSENLTIYHIRVQNSGNKIVEDVVCHIQILPAKVKNYRIQTTTPLTYTDVIINGVVQLGIESLNPEESVTISILGTSADNFPDEPQVGLRGKGINGQKAETEGGTKEKELKTIIYLLALIAGIASVLSLFIRKLFRDEDGDDKEEGKHLDDQNQIIAYLCGIHGIDKQVDRYLSLPRETTYWAEMDRLTSLGINSKSQTVVKKIKLILIDLMSYAKMAKSSKGIGYYNLARLEKYLENNEESDKYLVKAEGLIPELLKTRMTLDPLFKE